MAGTAGEKPVAPTRPEIRRAVVNESTVEGLREVLALTSDGTTIVVDELSGWFGGMDAYRGVRDS